jgi:acyl dehydratase
LAASPARNPYRIGFPSTRPPAIASSLVHRLVGDREPVHAGLKAAAAGGFNTPIPHGLCPFGVAGRAIIKAYCGDDTRCLTIRTEMMWP